MIVAVDFDGTCVTHEYPNIGKEIGAPDVLKKMIARGDQLILFTMRSGAPLDDAVAWFASHEIPLFGVNENPDQKTWTSSPKPYAHVYIDDAALNCPIARPPGERPYVNWAWVETLLGLDA